MSECCTCSKPGVLWVRDGGWTKPVCMSHAHLYLARGYVIQLGEHNPARWDRESEDQ